MNYKIPLIGILSISFGLALKGKDLDVKVVRYELEGATFESTIVFDGDNEERRPGILMVPNWLGPTENSLAKAKRIAGDKTVVMMVDMYGVDVRPSDGNEAGKAAGKVRGDRQLMRARAAKALSVFRKHAESTGFDPERIAAIGFCFGGGTVLELGRSGADLDAIVSFHGDLISPTLEADAGATRAKVMVLHGADDPYVPQTDVQQFIAAMRETEVDWELIQFSKTVHSFTDPEARNPGSAEYHQRSSDRAFVMMSKLFEEIWEPAD